MIVMETLKGSKKLGQVGCKCVHYKPFIKIMIVEAIVCSGSDNITNLPRGRKLDTLFKKDTERLGRFLKETY